MTYKDIIYNNLLRLLSSLNVDDETFEEFANEYDGDELDKILALSGNVSLLINEIEDSISIGKIITDFTALNEVIVRFETEYPHFQIPQLNELKLILTLIVKLEEAIAGSIDINVEELDVDEFVLEPLNKLIKEKNFYQEDTEISESLILIDLGDINNLTEWINDTQIGREMIAQLLAKIGNTVALSETQYTLVHSSLQGKRNAIQSLISLHLVLRGKVIYQPETYEQPLSIPPTAKVLKTNAYQQFSDAISILSDYNKDTDILDKFLRLYHLIENFMYRYPLVLLEAKHGGSFYIRDFQIMYEKVNNSESSSLKSLVKEIFSKDYDAATTFRDYIHTLWSSLINHQTAEQLSKLLTALGIEKDYLAIKGDMPQFHATFGKMVYAVRNSLVHNKDTEIHLTHESISNHPRLGNTGVVFLREFLMPSIVAISIYLLVEKNPIVWLENSNLELWSEN